MEGNKDEANRCIQIAEKYIQEKNREKAEKFLHKAERLFPTQKAKGLTKTTSCNWLFKFTCLRFIGTIEFFGTKNCGKGATKKT